MNLTKINGAKIYTQKIGNEYVIAINDNGNVVAFDVNSKEKADKLMQFVKETYTNVTFKHNNLTFNYCLN